MNNFNYSNIQKYMHGDKKITRKVIIKNGKGYKSVSYYKKGRPVKTIKKCLKLNHVTMIKNKQFIPGLFIDCRCKTYKNR